MTPKQFESYMAIYGTDIALWPSNEQELAKELLATSPQLRSLYQSQQTLDHTLADYNDVPPLTTDLHDKIMAQAVSLSNSAQTDSPIRHNNSQQNKESKAAIGKWLAFLLPSPQAGMIAASLALAALLSHHLLFSNQSTNEDSIQLAANNELTMQQVIILEDASAALEDELLELAQMNDGFSYDEALIILAQNSEPDLDILLEEMLEDEEMLEALENDIG